MRYQWQRYKFFPYRKKKREESGKKNGAARHCINAHDIVRLFRYLRFIRPNGQLTIAAILLFGKYTQRWLPTMTAKCISFVGNNIGGTQFRDKVNDTEMGENLLHQFETIMADIIIEYGYIENMDKQLSFNILQAIPYFIKKNKLNNFKKRLHQRLPRI